ncbi:chromatin-modulating protein MRC1 PWA37_002835 [Arxiozyma heterogenica]|uniref:chromatin-modulating protein MRC1 n=1 Tax=Arxiozyma heterogenica TaxID=278026 RepID=UPI002EE98DE5
MDILFKELGSIKTKKRTTYKKKTEPNEDEEQELPSVDNLDNGFLFHNSTLEKVKKRLANDSNEASSISIETNKESPISENDINSSKYPVISEDIQLSQTQLLKSMYGGEDLESIEKKQQEERRKKEVKEFNKKKREAKRRQREEAKREQELFNATQIIYQKYDLRSKNRYRHHNRTIDTSRSIEETFQELEKEAHKAEIRYASTSKTSDHVDDDEKNDEIPLSQTEIPLFQEKQKFVQKSHEAGLESSLSVSHIQNQNLSKPLTQATQINGGDHETKQFSIDDSTKHITKNIQQSSVHNEFYPSKTQIIPNEDLQYDIPSSLKVNESNSIVPLETDTETQVFDPINKKIQKISTIEDTSVSEDKHNGLPNMSSNPTQSIPLFSFTQRIIPSEAIQEPNHSYDSSTQIISNPREANLLENNQQKQYMEENDDETTQPTQVITTQTTQNINIIEFTQPTQEISHTEATQITQVTHSFPNRDTPNEVTLTLADTVVSNMNITATIADDATKNLKIHEIQRQLEKEEEEEFNKKNSEYRKIVPTVSRKLNFTKDSFLANFDSDSSESETEEQTLKDKSLNSTSLLNSDVKNSDISSRNEFNKKLSGLVIYTTNLKTQMDAKNKINLDSDGDSDEDLDRDFNGVISNNAKATILNIRARLSKTKKKNPEVNNKNNLDNLLENLRKKSRQQILDYQSELMENKGLTKMDLEKEKEVVENLLEQEILRNQKIRQREKEREKQKQQTENIDLNFDHSANELEESDFLDEDDDYDANKTGNSNSEGEPNRHDENDLDNEKIEAQKIDDNNKEEKEDEEEEEEEENFQLLKSKKSKHIHVSADSESDHNSEVEITEVPTTNKPTQNVDIKDRPNAIFLGHYGDNLDNITSDIDSQDNPTKKSENEITELNEETHEDRIKTMIEEHKHQQRLKEKKLKARKKELESFANLVEEEAEESEDEWHGIGGIDGEDSDEYDSEIEKMIDDYSKTDMNIDDIRKTLLEENRNMDIKMINKILYDIKNGNLRKRGRSALDLEISDDEDDELRNYRLKRRELMKQRLLDLGDNQKLVENPKAKAFFDSLVEDIIEIKNPFSHVEEFDQTMQSSTSSSEDDDDVSVNQVSMEKKAIISHESQNKKLVLSEAFVQKSLSFLNSNKDLDEYERNKELARLQHGEDVEDLFTLKQNSSIKSFRSLTSIQKAITLDDDNDETDIGIFKSSRPPSIIQSFNIKADINDKFKEGSKTVKISKSYKTVGGSKASITYMGKARKLVAPKTNSKNNPLQRLRKNNSNSRISKLFNNEMSNFGN